jgi:hypothetical protein
MARDQAIFPNRMIPGCVVQASIDRRIELASEFGGQLSSVATNIKE